MRQMTTNQCDRLLLSHPINHYPQIYLVTLCRGPDPMATTGINYLTVSKVDKVAPPRPWLHQSNALLQHCIVTYINTSVSGTFLLE